MSKVFANRVELIRLQKTKQYGKITIDLSIARSNESIGIQGNTLYVDSMTVDAVCTIKLNEISADDIPLKIFREIHGCFYRIFVTNTAQSNKSLTFFYSVSEIDADNDFSIKDYFLAQGAVISEVSTVIKDTSKEYYTLLNKACIASATVNLHASLPCAFALSNLTSTSMTLKIKRIVIISSLPGLWYFGTTSTLFTTDLSSTNIIKKLHYPSAINTSFRMQFSASDYSTIKIPVWIPANTPVELLKDDLIIISHNTSNWGFYVKGLFGTGHKATALFEFVEPNV